MSAIWARNQGFMSAVWVRHFWAHYERDKSNHAHTTYECGMSTVWARWSRSYHAHTVHISVVWVHYEHDMSAVWARFWPYTVLPFSRQECTGTKECCNKSILGHSSGLGQADKSVLGQVCTGTWSVLGHVCTVTRMYCYKSILGYERTRTRV